MIGTPQVRPRLTGIEIGADRESWSSAGFSVVDGFVDVAGVRIELTAAPAGVVALRFDDLPEDVGALDGIPLEIGEPGPSTEHPNGAIAIDQVVVATPEFERTASQLERMGLPLKREAIRPLDDDSETQVRQGFVRAGGAVIELVHTGRVPRGPAHVWGLGFISDRFDQALADLDGLIGPARPAIQPGRRIATFARDAGLGLPVVLLDPEPSDAQGD